MTELKLRDVLAALRSKGYKIRSKRYRGSFYAYKLVHGLPDHLIRIDTFRGPKGSKVVAQLFRYNMKDNPSHHWNTKVGRVPVGKKHTYKVVRSRRKRRS